MAAVRRCGGDAAAAAVRWRGRAREYLERRGACHRNAAVLDLSMAQEADRLLVRVVPELRLRERRAGEVRARSGQRARAGPHSIVAQASAAGGELGKAAYLRELQRVPVADRRVEL